MANIPPEIPGANGDQIKVGTTGTVSSLMSKELESIKQTAPCSTSAGKKLQDPPVSVPCGYSPRRSQLRKNLSNDPGSSSSSSNSNSGTASASSSKSSLDARTPKAKPRKSEHKSPMLASTEIALEKNSNKEKPEKEKKGRRTHIVEVVDLKCNNPMSSRLKKLGFSKLSESTAI